MFRYSLHIRICKNNMLMTSSKKYVVSLQELWFRKEFGLVAQVIEMTRYTLWSNGNVGHWTTFLKIDLRLCFMRIWFSVKYLLFIKPIIFNYTNYYLIIYLFYLFYFFKFTLYLLNLQKTLVTLLHTSLK